MSILPATRSPGPLPQGRTWRIATAARVFVLALATGQLLSAGNIDSAGITLLALVLIAAVACTVELEALGAWTRWVPVVEGVLAAVLIGTSEAPVDPLLIYLAVPPVLAGMRHGAVTTLNTSFATAGAMISAWSGAEQLGRDHSQAAASVPWLVVGVGAGLLTARLSRESRSVSASQAPYTAAHRLVFQLHHLSRTIPMGLDSRGVAAQILTQLTDQAGCYRGSLVIKLANGEIDTIAARGPAASGDQGMALACLDARKIVRASGSAALPVRVGEDTYGALVMSRTGGFDGDLDDLQEQLDLLALRLDTALLFDDVRSMATSEERHRLAREIHDGVAQEVASLGYAIDDLAMTSADPATRKAAEHLRLEVSRVVGELRLSILDLRHAVDETGGLSTALAEYVREVSGQGGIRAHLSLDEYGESLPRRTETELLRIAQEAISNVRKHSRAQNVWVSLSTEGRHLRLTVVDDGTGRASPRSGHYGLHTMRERAESIGAELVVEGRSDGGTIVTVQSRTAPEEGARDVHQRAAR